VNDSEKKSLN